MDTDQLRELQESLFETCKQEFAQLPYACDTLARYRVCESLGICSPADGALVRMTDRLAVLCAQMRYDSSKKAKVCRETVADLINDAVIFLALVGNKEG